MHQLQRLETIDPRTQWPDEAADFTPWVASEEGLQLIGETLGLELEQLESSSEVPVGDFRADVVCIDTSEPDNSIVLIENQLAPTNHTHVGQVLTYAAGLDAVTIIWIASEFREEHTATVDWLNKITRDRYRFFGLEIELVKIGNCGPAATFTIVAKPNNWSRRIRGGTNNPRPLNQTQLSHLRFWTQYIDQLGIKNRTPQPVRWFNRGIGSSDANLVATRSLQPPPRQLKVDLYLHKDNRDGYLAALQEQQEDIERDLGVRVEFVERGSTSAVETTVKRDPLDESDWPAQIEWFRDMLDRFDRVFRQRVDEIDTDDWMDRADDKSE